jgi:thiol-disulfide isomerase/thioredoxin
MLWIVVALALAQPADPETRVVEYLKANVRPGERVVVSDLYNRVFTGPEERAVLNRLFNDFFKIPLFAAQYQKSQGRPPSLADISEQFHFQIPGETEAMLRIMEADPRIPKFLRRDPSTGEILSVDVAAILNDPRFGKLLERTVTGWEGKAAPSFSIKTWDGKVLTSQGMGPYVLYFWFTNCPPCMKTAPLLVELQKAYPSLQIIGANADRVLELPFSEESRIAYARAQKIPFPLADLTPEMQEGFGNVSVFPTLFFVDRKGIVVKQLVSFQEKKVLEEAIRSALRP